MDMRQRIAELLAPLLNKSPAAVSSLLTIPPDPKLGDYALPCFTLGKNPKETATSLKNTIKQTPFLAKIETAGPYLNFFVNTSFLAQETLTAVQKEKKNYGKRQQKGTILVEYCGPNTNKPLHLGHLRNMAIGLTMVNIYRFLGKTVHPVNIVNDRGIHICQSMLAYQKWGKNKVPDKKGDHFVGDYYVMFAKAVKENEDLKKEAQELLLKWERGDRETRALWKKMTAWVLKGFQETYRRFGVQFDTEYFESQYYEKGKEVVAEGLKKGIFVKDHSEAVIAPLESLGLPDKVLLRGDETSLYITQDLYLADLRYRDYHYDRLIYVVASEQQLHFKQLFAILRLLKRSYADALYHLSYGLVNLPSGRMKSREGTVVDADDLLDELTALAEKEVQSRHANVSSKETQQRAEQIALAAIKFYMVRTDAVKDIVFNPEESLSFEGETGPYVQYTHARACSILRKALRSLGSKVDYALLQHPLEHQLVKKLSEFGDVVAKVGQTYQPHLLAHYLTEVAQLFSEYYHACPVISDDKQLMSARLLLVDSVRQVLQNGLDLLGIAALEEM